MNNFFREMIHDDDVMCSIILYVPLLSAISRSDIVFRVVTVTTVVIHVQGEVRQVYRRRPILEFWHSRRLPPAARQGVHILNVIFAYRDRNGYLF